MKAAIQIDPIRRDKKIIKDAFDVEYYFDTYPDVQAVQNIDPIEHFCLLGWREGRNPNRYFHTQYYQNRHQDELGLDENPFVHYLLVGKRKKYSPSPNELEDFLSNFEVVKRVQDLLINPVRFEKIMSDHLLSERIVPMFYEKTYKAQKALDPASSKLETLLNYLVFDFEKGLSPGPLFDGHYYAQIAHETQSTSPIEPEGAFLHWLESGLSSGVSPLPWFCDEDYLSLNADLEGYQEPLFMHFVRHGIIERRRFHPVITITDTHHPEETEPRVMAFFERFDGNAEAAEALAQKKQFLGSGELQNIYQRAMALEPEITPVERMDYSAMPPWHDQNYGHYECIARQFSETCDFLVLVPFCKMGGSDYVSGTLARTLCQMGKTIIIRTDQSDWVRPDWFPDEVQTVDLSAWFAPLDPDLRERILYELIRKLEPAHVFNVNSFLAFHTFKNYGARLTHFTHLHCYYFCSDQTSEGHEAGYPVSNFANILPYLSSAMFDTEFLSDRLRERYCLSDELSQKLKVMHSPALAARRKAPLAQAQLASRKKRPRPVILWAGRFDRQKRFDLFLDIARAMPHIDFKAWGTAVLDEAPQLDDVPNNVIIHPPYQSFDELPLENCDGLLYTSAWDGLPTILIEFGAMGMPIVASAVDGIPELLDDSTGWPVRDGAALEDYIAAIHDMLIDPKERLLRAQALQKKARERHSPSQYREALLDIITRKDAHE